MINFKEFLIESSTNYSFDKGCKLIKTHCQPFLTESNGRPLYRGSPRIRTIIDKAGKPGYSENKMDKISLIDHPSDRTPRNSDPLFNDIFNDMINSAFNVEDIRKKSVFVTGSYKDAMLYGTVNFCFPKGNFKFINSSKIRDSFGQDHLIFNGLKNEMNKYLPKNNKIKSFDDITNIIDASNNKLFNNDLDVEPYQIFIKSLKKVGLDLYTDKNISSAMENKNEILIYESNGYFMVPLPLIRSEYERVESKILYTDTSFKAYEYLLSRIS